MSGLRLASLYGFKPHQLGFCGPKDNGALLRFLKGDNVSKKKVKEILKQFEGAYPYYKRIAKNNNIKDPFDERVVRAYWVGNRLLEKDPKLYHCYHVLMVGSVTGRIVLKGKLLDLCRVGWGRVTGLEEKRKKLKVKYQPFISAKRLQRFKLRNARRPSETPHSVLASLSRQGREPCPLICGGSQFKSLLAIKLGKPVEKEIDWDKDLVPKIKIGNWVSFHWNQVVEVLSKEDRKNLEKYTKLTLNSL